MKEILSVGLTSIHNLPIEREIRRKKKLISHRCTDPFSLLDMTG
jgi:hypothetical protein